MQCMQKLKILFCNLWRLYFHMKTIIANAFYQERMIITYKVSLSLYKIILLNFCIIFGFCINICIFASYLFK